MKLSNQMKRFFGPNRQVVFASAPGRIDVMGGIGDYSGSCVLQMPIKERTGVYVALRNDGALRVHSASAKRAGHAETAECSLKQFPSIKKNFYAHAHDILNGDEENSWSAYIFGCALALIHDADAPIQGADFWIETKVPIGKGISSSAALETAVMSALCRALKIQLPGNQLPVLAQRVENEIVGAPCGLMDQLACYFGRANKLLPILCQPDIVGKPVEIPRNLQIIGIDSGVRHSVNGNAYGDARTAAFMGYSVIANQLGVSKTKLAQAKNKHDQNALPFQGYLANITPSLFEKDFASLLPVSISGKKFIEQYGNTIDAYTTPKASRSYSVRSCAQYPIYENQRVKIFRMIAQHLNQTSLNKIEREACCMQLGELMMQSHQGYNRCRLGSDATDALVERAIEFGPENGIYGAKITGGGSGGVVCFLCEGRKGAQSVRKIAALHTADFQCESTVFTGSSDGACWSKPITIQS
ncbi:MAG: galactokinase family protein [Candidatus Hinthialibacter antarcticus]|nr:galactokinase family protein [Candidatus Hinthialibacter antarcticus]